MTKDNTRKPADDDKKEDEKQGGEQPPRNPVSPGFNEQDKRENP